MVLWSFILAVIDSLESPIKIVIVHLKKLYFLNCVKKLQTMPTWIVLNKLRISKNKYRMDLLSIKNDERQINVKN